MRLILLVLLLFGVASGEKREAESSIERDSAEFIVSYKALIKNHILIGEEYNVVKALREAKNYQVIGVCDFVDSSEADSKETQDFRQDSADNYTLDSKIESTKTLLIALRQNKDEILECFNKNTQSKIRDDVKFINQALHFNTQFSIAPQRILATHKGGKIQIKIIRENI